MFSLPEVVITVVSVFDCNNLIIKSNIFSNACLFYELN